jgi:hypothetical protein
MTKEEIIEMAMQIGGCDRPEDDSPALKMFVTFAKLVAEKAIKEALAQPEQEPVAIRYDFDGYGYQYIDSGTGSDWQTRVQGEPLYTAPQPKQEPVAWMTINEYGEEDDIHYENPEGNLLEGWTYKPLYTTPQTAQAQEEPLELFEYWNAVEGWVKIEEVREHFDSVGCGTIYKTSGEDRVPLYTKPQIKGCAECGVNDNNHALYCVTCAENYLKDKNT